MLINSPFTFHCRGQNSPSLFMYNLGGCPTLHFLSTKCWPAVERVSADTRRIICDSGHSAGKVWMSGKPE